MSSEVQPVECPPVLIWFLSLHSNSSPCFVELCLSVSSSPAASALFPIFSAADKEVDDYYTRKRHLPDLAARSTLPLHVLKMSQDQVGARQNSESSSSESSCFRWLESVSCQ